VAPPVPSQADKEKREREEREQKEKEDKEKREREEQEKARKLKEEQEQKEKEKRDKEEREKKEKEEKERKEREEKEKKEREEREGTRKGRLEGARAMFERGSAAPPAVDHAKAAEERKAKIFQTGSLGARIESLGSKKSDTQPTPAAQPAAATTAPALGSRTSHGAEEKGTNASGQPPAKANGAVDSAAAAEQERKLHELQRKFDEALTDNKKLKSEKEERVRELEGKTKELERMLADKNQEIWNLREDQTAAAASKDMGEQLAKLRAEAEAERKSWQKKVEDMERDAAKLREEKDRAVTQLKEEKDRELARVREEKDREIARLREEKAAAEKRFMGDGEAPTAKTQELQRMLADKNQEIWDLREALEKREKESAQAAARSERDGKDRSERDAREAEELVRLRSALENKDRELSELREKVRHQLCTLALPGLGLGGWPVMFFLILPSYHA
jgi:hypothetical protein